MVCVLNFHCYNDFVSASSHAKRCFAKGDYHKLSLQLDLEWDSVFEDIRNDPSKQWSKFLSILNEAIDDCIPLVPPASSSRAKIPANR